MPLCKRLILDLRPEQHSEIKRRATQQGKTIKQYVLEKVFPQDTLPLQPEKNPWVDLAVWASRESPLRGQSDLVAEASRDFRGGFRLD
jgi:hypothetical protein